jgi:regulator of protease activity HflC (stomatin/prohibitin superfamily)
MGWLIALSLVLLVLAVVLARFGSITVQEYERALKFEDGQFVAVVGPGKYRFLTHGTRFHSVDTRLVHEAVSGQEVLSSDAVAFKASLLASYRIVDPKLAVLETQNVQEAVHSALQLGLRALIAGRTSEELLQQRAEGSAVLLGEAQLLLAKVGVALEQVALRDLTLPGDLKKSFSQVAQARQEGLAALERARGETAALRNLANVAQLMERHPSLLQLRLLQTISERSGNTVVVGSPPSFGPVIPTQSSSGPPGEAAAE